MRITSPAAKPRTTVTRNTRTHLCRMPLDLHDWLDSMAERHHTTKTALIIRAIRELQQRLATKRSRQP